MGKWLARAWRTRGFWAVLLWPSSVLYGWTAALHKSLYTAGILKTERSNVPVIVVGNVVAGGAGKTPLVIALARHLQQKGLKVGVVSRGYGRRSTSCLEVLESTPVLTCGDEPALIFKALEAPVFVANKRIDAARALLAKYPGTQVIISDDGLQHHRMARDIEITVFDDSGIGNGWLLPAGPLRESWRPDLQKRALVLHTGQSPAFAGFTSTRRLADRAADADGNTVLLSSLCTEPLVALAGIANPQAFFDMLTARGLKLVQAISLPDHFDFLNYTMTVLPETTVLCTEKDAVKLFKLEVAKTCRLLAVPLEFVPDSAFMKAVDAQLARLLTQADDRST